MQKNIDLALALLFLNAAIVIAATGEAFMAGVFSVSATLFFAFYKYGK